MSNVITMKADDWYDQFQPIQNHIDTNAPLDGCMFETYGEELDYVREQNPNTIWTYIDGEDGNTFIIDGYHLVNRLGYIISSQPRSDNVSYEIIDN